GDPRAEAAGERAVDKREGVARETNACALRSLDMRRERGGAAGTGSVDAKHVDCGCLQERVGEVAAALLVSGRDGGRRRSSQRREADHVAREEGILDPGQFEICE